MANEEKPKEAAQETETPERGCPVEMFWNPQCGRPIYEAPRGVDELPVCLMHSHDREKDNGAFQAEIDRILLRTGLGIADFTGFFFPRAKYLGRVFEAKCFFQRATLNDANFCNSVFMQHAHFIGATFRVHVNFLNAQFQQTADFLEAVFDCEAWFGDVVFTDEADFRETKFTRGADFRGAAFTQGAKFYRTTFTEKADFGQATFSQGANFEDATFTQKAQFNSATFAQEADFWRARFMQEADFNWATFTKSADFSEATFTQDAHFSWVTFTQEAEFTKTTFQKIVYFSEARFLEGAGFRQTIFRHDPEDDDGEPGPTFSLARFEKPERVVFYETYLGQALFHNCDVSKVVFSNVEWRRRKGTGKSMVFEEEVRLIAAPALCRLGGSTDQRKYGLVAELYQQLKKNYDGRGDYWTAGDFHYGEMEMKRLASPRRNWFLRWWHQNLGLVAWYKYFSDYGESYVKPILRLVIVLALFSLIYPACGLRRVFVENPRGIGHATDAGPQTGILDEHSYANYFQFLAARCEPILPGPLAFFVRSLMTAVAVAVLRRDFATYEPSSELGRVTTLVEFLLTSTLIALFLLAVRRQFRR